VLDGKITRSSSVRVIRDGIVVYTGKMGSLRRFRTTRRGRRRVRVRPLRGELQRPEARDIIEAFTQVEVAATLA